MDCEDVGVGKGLWQPPGRQREACQASARTVRGRIDTLRLATPTHDRLPGKTSISGAPRDQGSVAV